MRSTDEEQAQQAIDASHQSISPSKKHGQMMHAMSFEPEDHLLNDMQFAEIKHDTVLAVRQMQIVKDEDHISVAEICDVLLIVTGGTLCMVQSDNGYVPCFGLADRLKKYDKFYDGAKAAELGLP